jgi:alkylation response protein AidB-like acyl-CoA dehydrogenase
LDALSTLQVIEAMSVGGSWVAAWAVHTGVGTLPIAWFGTEAQKRRWLPGLANGEVVGAYALSESGSGSDALSARTRAMRTEDGKHWILDGSKQWITNAAFADLFVVFAQANGDQFTAFLVERGTPGFTVGEEEHKMGLRGSSTCPLSLENVRIPAENVLGEIGKGHRIAFNVLNVGRVKLGASSIASARGAVRTALAYARERRVLGRTLAQLGLIREKLARMVALVYAGEAMSHRVAGLVDARVAAGGSAPGTAARAAAMLAAAEEFAPEASILKVWGTDTMSVVADEVLQIHGAYGLVEEYGVERTYRDMRVGRIVEGTNEINRMLVTGTLLRRAMKGAFPFDQVSRFVDAVVESGPPPLPSGALARERRLAEMTKGAALLALRTAVETIGPGLADRQEVLAATADAIIEAFAVDCAVTRALQAPGPLAEACAGLYAREGHERALGAARRSLRATLPDAADCAVALDKLRTFADEGPADVVAMRERILEAVLETW